MKMHHELKIEPQFFEAVLDGRKTFEIRRNDRGFQAGDTVTLMEYTPYKALSGGRLTGRRVTATVGYVIGYEQKEGFVVFSLINVQKESED